MPMSKSTRDRAQRPFWLHQLTEYLIGFALIMFGFQDTKPTMPAVAGIILLANAAIVRGPAGAFKLIGRRIHRWVDVIVIVILVGCAVQPWVEVSALGRLVLVAIVVPYVVMWWYTDWDERADRKARRVEAAGQGSEELGRTAGRAAATAYLAGKRAIKKRSES